MASGVVEWVLKLVNQVSGPAAAASVSTRALTQSTAAAGTQFGKLGAAMGPLGGILARISPELGAVGASIAGLTSASNTAAAGLGISAGAMGVALGGVAAAAAGLYGAYRILTHESELATAAEALHAKHALDLQPVLRSLEDQTLKLAVATGQLTEAQAGAETSYRAAVRGAEDYAAAHREEVDAIGKGVIANEGYLDTLDTIGPAVVALTGSTALLGLAHDYLTESIDAGRESLSFLQQEEQKHTDSLLLLADQTDAVAAANEKKKKAEEAAAAATRQHKADADALTKSIEEQTAAYEKWIAEYNKGKADDAGSAASKRGSDLVARMSAEAEMAAESAAEIEESGRKWAEYAARAAASAKEAQGVAMLGAAGTATSFANNPMGTLASSTGPWGAIIFGLMEAITNLDKTLSGLSDFGRDFQASIKTAPQDFAKFLVEQVKQGDPFIDLVRMVPEFVSALVKAFPQILRESFADIGPMAAEFIEFMILDIPKVAGAFMEVLFDPQTWLDAGKALMEGFAKGFDELGKELEKAFTIDKTEAGAVFAKPEHQSSGNIFADAWMYGDAKGSHADGADYVDKTGLYVLHRGEVVNTSARQNAASGGGMAAGSGQGRMVGRGGKVYIEIDADSLNDTFGGLRGRGYSLGAS